MTDEIPRSQLLLARVVVGLLAAFVVGGIVWFGLSAESLGRIWQNMLDRPGGPFAFRFVLQPIMATVAALRGGIHDARLGRAPFLRSVLTDPSQRRRRLDEALVATSRIVLLGLVMDAAYQLIEFDLFHPAEAVIISLLLAVVPYVLMRGLVTRLAGRWVRSKPASDAQ